MQLDGLGPRLTTLVYVGKEHIALGLRVQACKKPIHLDLLAASFAIPGGRCPKSLWVKVLLSASWEQ